MRSRLVSRTRSLTSNYVCDSCLHQVQRHKRSFATVNAIKADPSPSVYDVVCVGGGPAGLSLLTALRAHPSTSHLKTILIDSAPLALAPAKPAWIPQPDSYSNRCSSLTPASVAFLERIDAWKYVRRERVQAYSSMQVWDGVGGGRIEFDWASISAGQRDARNTIAFMVENVNLTNGLLAKLGELGGVEVVGGTKVQSLTYGQDTAAMDLSTWPVVELANGRKIAARLLVGADGANSSVRQFADIESRGWDYERHGLVATLRLAPLSERRSSSNELTSKALTAYQRFLPTGPIALLPLPDNHASLVWSTLPHHAAHLKTLSKRDFLAMVNAAFRLSPVDLQYMLSMASTQAEELAWRAQHTEFPASKIPDEIIDVQDASIASFPLRFRHADTYIRPRIALIGDAAHTVHPLAGQGLNQGQGDVQALADRIAWATERGADIGDMFVLEGYESQRYATNHVLAGTVDKLHKVFALENPLLAGARSWGFGMVNQLSPLKGWLMARAGGG